MQHLFLRESLAIYWKKNPRTRTRPLQSQKPHTHKHNDRYKDRRMGETTILFGCIFLCHYKYTTALQIRVTQWLLTLHFNAIWLNCSSFLNNTSKIWAVCEFQTYTVILLDWLSNNSSANTSCLFSYMLSMPCVAPFN